MLVERPIFFGIVIPGFKRKLTICQSKGKDISLFREEINDACIDVLEEASQRPAFYSPLLGWRVFWR